MNEYLFYYNIGTRQWDKIKEDGSYIWYSVINAANISDAVKEFIQFVDDEDRIIQIIVKNKLH